MIVDVLVAMSCGLIGLLCGWLIYPTVSSSAADEPPTPEEDPAPPPAEAGSQTGVDSERERLSQIAARVRTLNARVAANVDAHQSRIREVNEALTEVDLRNEPELILEAMNKLLDASEQMRDQLEQAEDRLQEQSLQLQTAEQRAMTDALTRLANRRALDEHLQRRIEENGAQATTMMLFDIDHFKHFNDSYGHLAGDEVLRVVAKMVQARCQEQCLVARYGGEEFAIVFNDQTIDQCREAAEQIRAAIGNREINFEDKRLRVTASAGLAQHMPGESVEEWIRRTDKGLYASKEADRNCGHLMEGDNPVRITLPPEEPILRPRRESKPEEAPPRISASPAADELPDYLNRLPSGDQLQAEFTELLTGLTGVGVAFVAAIVQLDDDQADVRDLEVVARTARKVIRSVDRIGLLDRQTLVIGMPSVDLESAVMRADDIRQRLAQYADEVLQSAEALSTITISLSSSRDAESFEEILAVALRDLEAAKADGPDQTVVHWDLVATTSPKKTS